MHDIIEKGDILYNFDEQEKQKDRIVVGLILIGSVIVGLIIYPIDIRSEEDIINIGVIIVFCIIVLLIPLYELKPSYFTPEMFVYQPSWSFKQPIKIDYDDIKEIEINWEINHKIMGIEVYPSLSIKYKDKTYTLLEGKENIDKIIDYLIKIKKDNLVKIVK